jgi:hypothetical protein
MAFEHRVRLYAGPRDGDEVTVRGDTFPTPILRIVGYDDGVYWQSEDDAALYEWEQWPDGGRDDDELVEGPDVSAVDDAESETLADVMRVLAERARVERSEWAQRAVDECRRNHPSMWRPDGDA